jgi:hypothetical protein
LPQVDERPALSIGAVIVWSILLVQDTLSRTKALKEEASRVPWPGVARFLGRKCLPGKPLLANERKKLPQTEQSISVNGATTDLPI